MFLRFLRLCILLILAGTASAAAEDPSPQEAAIQNAFTAAMKVATQGPADVALRDLATVHLPDPYVFIPANEGAAIMRAFGNSTEATFYGLIFPKQADKNWFVTIDYIDSGYLKDDDAKSWKAEDLMQNIKDGTDEANKDRVERGFPPLEVVDWVERPAYDESTHRLVWSILARDRGNTTQPATINYNTYALGRRGYFSLNLVTGEDAIAEDKKNAGMLLAALDYKPGHRYGDFDVATDKVAEYGLAALIGGVAAKKLGLLAVIGLFFAKFWKVVLIGLAVAGGGFTKLTRLFRRNTTPPQA